MRPGTKDLTDAANLGHHVRRSDGGVEVDLATLDGGHKLIGADDVGAGLLGLASLLALGEHGDANGLAGAVGQGDGTTDVLVSLAGVDTQTEVGLNGLVKLGRSDLLDELHGLKRAVELELLDLLRSGAEILSMLRHVLPPVVNGHMPSHIKRAPYCAQTGAPP